LEKTKNVTLQDIEVKNKAIEDLVMADFYSKD
jgi:hypothetical protein